MTKRINQQIEEIYGADREVRLSIGTLVVVGLSIIGIVIATFTLLKLPNSQAFASFFASPSDFIANKVYLKSFINYIPQIPILLFICAILGRKYSMIVVVLYLILGLFFPIYAMGGGFKYFLEYNFGYILAYIPTAFFVTTILKKDKKLFTIFKATLAGVLIIHLLGMIYLTLVAIVRHDSLAYAWSMIANQKLEMIMYDFVFGFLSILFAKPVKKILMLAMG